MHNQITIIGRVGQDPESKEAKNKGSVSKINVATTKRWKDKDGEKQEQTQWHTVIAWRGLSEYAGKWIKKGDLIHVQGEMTYRKWEDKNGVSKISAEIVASSIQRLIQQDQGQKPVNEVNNEKSYKADDDLPF